MCSLRKKVTHWNIHLILMRFVRYSVILVWCLEKYNWFIRAVFSNDNEASMYSIKKNVMSIKLNRFDVTIGQFKVTFGMWNLSKIFLTIKCASSVRTNSNGRCNGRWCSSLIQVYLELVAVEVAGLSEPHYYLVLRNNLILYLGRQIFII
jgi:hypothetical protein